MDGWLYLGMRNEHPGAQLWRSANGVDWQPIILDGFGESSNYATLWSNANMEYEGQLLFGTWNQSHGGEL